MVLNLHDDCVNDQHLSPLLSCRVLSLLSPTLCLASLLSFKVWPAWHKSLTGHASKICSPRYDSELGASWEQRPLSSLRGVIAIVMLFVRLSLITLMSVGQDESVGVREEVKKAAPKSSPCEGAPELEVQK
jgi:hypothetical protein